MPKLNFSTCHDAWLGKYARTVSTPIYYQVCNDLIAEVCDLFDGPRLFHLGMGRKDRRASTVLRVCSYPTISTCGGRTCCSYIDAVNKAGARAGYGPIMSGIIRKCFIKICPSRYCRVTGTMDVLTSARLPKKLMAMKSWKHTVMNVRTGSNCSEPDNMRLTVEYCQNTIAPERLRGFLMSVWKPTLETCRTRHEQAIYSLEQAKQAFTANRRSPALVCAANPYSRLSSIVKSLDKDAETPLPLRSTCSTTVPSLYSSRPVRKGSHSNPIDFRGSWSTEVINSALPHHPNLDHIDSLPRSERLSWAKEMLIFATPSICPILPQSRVDLRGIPQSSIRPCNTASRRCESRVTRCGSP